MEQSSIYIFNIDDFSIVMSNSSYFKKTLFILSIIERRGEDELKKIEIDEKELNKMLSILEQLGLLEKKSGRYVISQKGKNVLNYFKKSIDRLSEYSPLYQ